GAPALAGGGWSLPGRRSPLAGPAAEGAGLKFKSAAAAAVRGRQRRGGDRMGCQSEKRQRRPPEKQQQQEVTGSSKNLPFLGKSFYLDLPNNKNMEFLVATIKQLGGVIESFLSKEVSYVVSSSKEAKLDSGPQRQTEKRSSTASGDAKAKTLPSAVPKGSHAGHHHKPADSALISRGKELLQKAMR
ncbi:DBF4 zinc finger B, partial [Chelydra serpentina]